MAARVQVIRRPPGQQCAVRGTVVVAMVWLGLAGCRAPQGLHTSTPGQPWTAEGLSGRRILTEHFEIISTLRDPDFEAALPAFLETVYDRYTSTIAPSRDARSERLTTYVFGTRGEWADFARRRYPTRFPVYARIRTGGFTEGTTAVSFYRTRAATLATLAHEGWHQYVAGRIRTPLPAWLNEGLACYHEAVDYAGLTPKFTPRYNTFRIESLRRAIQLDRLFTLRDVVDTDAGQVIVHVDGELAQTYYAQAWALVTFLRHDKNAGLARRFDRMLQDISDGTFSVKVSAHMLTLPLGTTAGEAAFRTYFEAAPQDLEDAYYDHLIRTAGFRDVAP